MTEEIRDQPHRPLTGQLKSSLDTSPRPRARSPRQPSNKRSFATVGLFAGIGGIELGLERAGHECLQLCELDPAAVAVLRASFVRNRRLGRTEGDLPIERDVRDVARRNLIPPGTELLAAGFPCQDLSQAGKTAGIDGSESGLVRSVLEILRRRDIPWVLLENVPFMLQLARGRALDFLLTELESLHYSWAYRVVDTRAFGLPQRRQRVLIVATKEGDPRDVLLADDGAVFEPEPKGWNRDVACGFYWTEGVRGLGWAVDAIPTLKGGSTIGIPSPPAIILPNGDLIKPSIWDAERLQGFRKNWTKPAGTVGRASFRWKLVGNAVSVPVAKWLGKCLAEPRNAMIRNVRELGYTRPWPDVAWNVGDGRFTGAVSRWPQVPRRKRHLADFLRDSSEPLSRKATAGFYYRATEKSSLRFPAGFLNAVASHLARLDNPDS